MKEFIKIWFPIFLLIVGAFYLTSLFIKPSAEKKIVLATGQKNGMYYQLALRYKKLLEAHKVKVSVIETKGSIDTLDLLNSGKADVGFVQGGTVDTRSKMNLEALASIFYEPLWIFYAKRGFHPDMISDFRGKRIAIGAQGSGTRSLSLQLLHANGVDQNNTTLLPLSAYKAYAYLEKGELDAFFTVVSPESKWLAKVLSDPNVHLMDIARIQAYQRHFDFLTSFIVPKGSVDLAQNIPNTDVTLISTVASLAVRKDFPPELIRLLLKEVKKSQTKSNLFLQTEQFPSMRYLELPINSAARKYWESGDSFLEKIFPYWVAYNIDRFKIMLIPFLTLLIPLIKGFFPLYRWRVRSKIYRWYDEIYEIEKGILSYDYTQVCEKYEALEQLSKDILQETKVPLPYMGEYYDLKVHVEMIRQKLQKLKETQNN